MAITKLSIRNFTVFEKINLDFCKGINIFIGENGTGKTHLLKLMYFLTKSLEEGYVGSEFEKIFMAKPQQIIRNLNIEKQAECNCIINDSKAALNIFGDLAVPVRDKRKLGKTNPFNSVFIPAKEMLSHSDGFLALSKKYKIPFDKTLTDIIVNAELPETWDEPVVGNKILHILEDAINGKVIYENGNFYVEKNNGLKISFSLEAEGFRKIGLLWRLIRNGSVNENTTIFWDEPEANLNPQLISVLVDILLELQRVGVQLFIATHEYHLAKYFEVKSKKSDEILYLRLLKTANGVKCSQSRNYRSIEANPIEMAYERLYDDILDKAAEELGDER